MSFDSATISAATRILLVDDDHDFCRRMQIKLEDYDVHVVHSEADTIPAIIGRKPDVVLLDIEMEHEDSGLRILAELQTMPDRPAVIMLTRDDRIDTIHQAGVYQSDGYLHKKADLATLQKAMHQALNDSGKRIAPTETFGDETKVPSMRGIISSSVVFRNLLAQLSRVASSKATVLLQGETGTGKGLLAREIHNQSGRQGPFVRCDATTLPRELMHAELIGYVKGAFTGAHTDYNGHFAAAHEGTLFVDEIGLASPEMQGALLHAVEHGEVTPLGKAGKPKKHDVRIIAATNADLQAMSRNGLFKPDLLARLNVYPLTIPPLRNRRDDILPLALHYLKQYAKEEGRKPMTLSHAVKIYLRHQDWSENVRGIENAMRRAVIDAPGPVVELAHIISRNQYHAERIRPYAEVESDFLGPLQREYLMLVMSETKGRVSEAADISGVARKTLYKWLDKHGIDKKDYRE